MIMTHSRCPIELGGDGSGVDMGKLLPNTADIKQSLSPSPLGVASALAVRHLAAQGFTVEVLSVKILLIQYTEPQSPRYWGNSHVWRRSKTLAGAAPLGAPEARVTRRAPRACAPRDWRVPPAPSRHCDSARRPVHICTGRDCEPSWVRSPGCPAAVRDLGGLVAFGSWTYSDSGCGSSVSRQYGP